MTFLDQEGLMCTNRSKEGDGYQSSIANANKRAEIATRKITSILTTLALGCVASEHDAQLIVSPLQ